MEFSNLDQLRSQLQTELERSILITSEDRAFWLQELPTLSQKNLEDLFQIIAPKDAVIDDLIETALAQDTDKQEHLQALKAEVARIKRHANVLEEGSEKVSEEAEGEALLSQLD